MFRLLLAAIFLAVAASAIWGIGSAVMRERRRCPRCGRKTLARINWFRCHPPPNRSFFACDACGAEFVQVDRYDGGEAPMIPREGSPWASSPGWQVGDRSGPEG